MDSGNSGSMQSSSGGSEEYNSRADSISAFLNYNPSSHISHGPLGNQPPPLLPQQQHQSHSSSAMFDPLSNYYAHPLARSPQLTTNPNSLLNLDGVWSKNLGSEPNCTDLGGFMASSSPTQQLLTNHQAQSRDSFPSMQIPEGPEIATKSSVSGTSDQPNNNNMVRNPKKRSRASRRAPTTVLTTDTSNFRAMVQEFTGIPAPPFTSSSFPRTRLDLFGTPSSIGSTYLDPSPPHYLLRPFAQKFHPPPIASSSTTSSLMIDAIASTPSTKITSASASDNNTSSSSTSINYQRPSELGLLKQPQNLLNVNMQNPILSFQSLLEAPAKYALPNSTILGTKPRGSLDIPPNIDSSLKMGVLEEFGLSQGHVNTNLSSLQNMVSSNGALPRNENSTNPPSWGEGTVSQERDQSLLRSINGSYNSNNQRVSNGKMSNFSASSSDFHGDKGPENMATRSEGETITKSQEFTVRKQTAWIFVCFLCIII
ncbi:uncharacterized protein DDB_G0271670-like [Durio zibethinus]|uniref:Uncharacterized protein DDB_G0271670-like n=1 Tax=Durio zibethinus TaxID=66656 RepID=A0A6P5ZE65_DURZI|nr:uncharacterized protein DDB_G0271670-like [Durio zibethinus]